MSTSDLYLVGLSDARTSTPRATAQKIQKTTEYGMVRVVSQKILPFRSKAVDRTLLSRQKSKDDVPPDCLILDLSNLKRSPGSKEEFIPQAVLFP